MPIYEQLHHRLIRRVFFIHIPKCAGSYIEAILNEKYTGNFLFSKRVPAFMKVVPQHLTHEEILSLNIVPCERDFCFAVVRNPYDRVESEFFYQKRVYKIPYEIEDFSNWLLHSVTEVKKDPYHMKSHFRPQTNFLGDRVHVYKFESGMKKILSELESNLGPLDNKVKKVNSSDRQKLSWSNEAIDVFNDYYAEDFTRLGYVPSKESTKKPKYLNIF